jgi:hypothetical protein
MNEVDSMENESGNQAWIGISVVALVRLANSTCSESRNEDAY